MKIAFLSPSVSRSAGGIFEIQRGLAFALTSRCHVDLDVYGLCDEFTTRDAALWEPLRVHSFKVLGPRAFGFSIALRNSFLSSSADVAHLHALWTYPSILIREWSRRQRRPYVTTLNGMLEPWAIKNSYLKKRLATLLYEARSLSEAGCIQVNTEAELVSARSLGLKNPIAIVPNGVDLPKLEGGLDDTGGELGKLKKEGRRILLFLGRLHKKKGLPNLIRALTRIPDEKWILAIAGWDQSGHESELRGLSRSLNVDNRVLFLGPRYGTQKELILGQADAFILPSFSEGLPMAVLEAWAYAKPVVMTPACNLSIGYHAGAAISVDPSVESLQSGLASLFEMTNAELHDMGSRGRRLAAERFSWSSVAESLHSVYAWLLDRGAPPDCVVLNDKATFRSIA